MRGRFNARGFEISTALDALSPQQRYQFESSVPPALWTWLWNLPVPSEQEPELVPADEPADEPESVPEPELVDEPESEPEPTLEELKALLLARDSLVQINSLKRKHSKTVAIAYNSMNVEEQSHVDALAALAVPHKVCKYLGDEIK